MLRASREGDEAGRAVTNDTQQQGQLGRWFADHRKVRDVLQALGSGMGDQIANFQTGQRSRAIRAQLCRDQAAALVWRLERLANLGRCVGYSEFKVRHPGVWAPGLQRIVGWTRQL